MWMVVIFNPGSSLIVDTTTCCLAVLLHSGPPCLASSLSLDFSHLSQYDSDCSLAACATVIRSCVGRYTRPVGSYERSPTAYTPRTMTENLGSGTLTSIRLALSKPHQVREKQDACQCLSCFIPTTSRVHIHNGLKRPRLCAYDTARRRPSDAS